MHTINPATGKEIKSYPQYSLGKIDDFCRQTHESFLRWSQISFLERGKRMKEAAKILIKNKEQYARLMAEEMGKPITQGRSEIEKCAWGCNFYADEAQRYLSLETIKTDAAKSFVTYEPLGVVLAVMPWNFPFWQVFRCAAPTLMAGNAVVLKHSSNVCGCSLAIEEIFKEAGFDGAFGSLLASSSQIKNVIENPLIQAVTLTGSTTAGKSIASIAGGVIKKTVLELGGSDPYIILKDAPLDKTVECCVASRLINSGQSCIAAKRFIVEEQIIEAFTKLFVKKMKEPRMGDPLKEDVNLGPLARHDLRDQLHAQVKKSVSMGANLLLGGEIPFDNPGAFYPPTVLVDARRGMPAYDEELFGPVAVILKAKDEQEAVKMANDTIFGLGAAIFTIDLKKAESIASKELQAGVCFINDFVKSDPRLPFGGIKQSGYGRELSEFGIREFVNIKTVYLA